MIEIYSDGGYNPRYDIGSFAAVFYQDGELIREINGAVRGTNAFRMELYAAVEALKVLKPGSEVTIYTDCLNLKNKAEELRDNDLFPNGNFNLWRDLQTLMIQNVVRYEKVDGHSGIEGNHKAHRLCVWAMAEELRK